MNLPPDRYKPDAATMATLYDALNMVVIALSQSMPPAQQDKFAANLAELARVAEKQGRMQLETALLDLWREAYRR